MTDNGELSPEVQHHHSQGSLRFSDEYSEVTGKEQPGFNSSVWLASKRKIT